MITILPQINVNVLRNRQVYFDLRIVLFTMEPHKYIQLYMSFIHLTYMPKRESEKCLVAKGTCCTGLMT